jgi:hypothetical protein
VLGADRGGQRGESCITGADERAAKLAELSEVLARADSVDADADADGWPLRRSY